MTQHLNRRGNPESYCRESFQQFSSLLQKEREKKKEPIRVVFG